MHILLIHQAFAALDEAGGTRHYEMARCLVNQGHQVTIITSPVSYLTGKSRTSRIPWIEKQEPEPGITILRTYVYSAMHRSFFHRVVSFLSFMVSSFFAGIGIHKVDLVWGTSPPIFQGFTAWLIARLKRVPFLFEIRDLWPAFAVAIGVLRSPLLIRLSLWLESFLYSHADRVMVNSPGFIEHVKSRGAKQVELIPNGADPAMFNPTATGEDFRREHGLEGKFIVLYAGAHGMSNDLGVVIEAAAELQSQTNIQFVLIGDGKDKPSLQKQAQTLGLENLIFLAPVAKIEMIGVLAAADACIAILKPLELYKTTYPNKVFDYMAAGRPVILAIDGVIRGVVESCAGGLFSPPGDSSAMAKQVRLLASNPISAREMGLAGRRYVEQHFNRTILSGQLLSLLIEMEKKHGFA